MTDQDLQEKGINREQYNEIQGFFKFQSRLKSLKVKCTLKTFEDIFGDSEGERLFQHYGYQQSFNSKNLRLC